MRTLLVLAVLTSFSAFARETADTVVANGKILQVRFESVSTRREALRILADKAASLKPGDWIMVQGGWTPRQFADAPGGFTLQELDGIAPKRGASLSQ